MSPFISHTTFPHHYHHLPLKLPYSRVATYVLSKHSSRDAFRGTLSARLPGRSPLVVEIGVYYIRDANATSDYVDSAVKLLDDLGKALPFVATAFILLKVIVDAEKRARDSLACPCQPSSEPPQRQVIDQMNSVLKETAALVEAYRNQSGLARNKEKFETCAKALAEITKGLMMSLQIHQSVLIDTILQRNVPQDPQDEKAKRFVEKYGAGDQAVVEADKGLLKQSAEELKLSVSVEEEAMETLNANLGDLLRAHQAQLERRLDDTIRASLTSKEVDMEQTLICVQCEKESKQSINYAQAYSTALEESLCEFRVPSPFTVVLELGGGIFRFRRKVIFLMKYHFYEQPPEELEMSSSLEEFDIFSITYLPVAVKAMRYTLWGVVGQRAVAPVPAGVIPI
ncbi:hypothetical protein VNI00_013457 [Paramarasmius palmivorus]|uniref:Uncharacterized protein n=1 Tax=Paramarasmius palmivorus TaxID=297713 RepID=A0AAW0BYW0_9AGAR